MKPFEMHIIGRKRCNYIRRILEKIRVRVSIAGFGISGIEPSGSATIQLVSKMDVREMGCEDERWMELAQDRVRW
jgi:hypothetical protein